MARPADDVCPVAGGGTLRQLLTVAGAGDLEWNFYRVVGNAVMDKHLGDWRL